MKQLLSLLISFVIIFSSASFVVYADNDYPDAEIVVDESFDSGTETWKDVLSLKKTDYTGVSAEGYLHLGYNYNIISTIDSYSDYIIQFDYNPYYYNIANDKYPRIIFTVGGYEFHMRSLASGISAPQGVTSGASITKENDFTFINREWSTIRVEKVAKAFSFYAKNRSDEEFTLVYKGTFAENKTAPFKFNAYDTSNVQSGHIYDYQAYMDNLKIWNLSLSAVAEDKLYDINPGKVTVTFNNKLADNIPDKVTVSDGINNTECELVKIDDKTVEIIIPDNVLDYNTEYNINLSEVSSAEGCKSNNVAFNTIIKIKANIDGEQIARKGTEIIIDLSLDGDLLDEYLLTAEVPECIDISGNGKTFTCDAYTEDNKIVMILPEQIEFSTEYIVDLSEVTAVYKINNIDYFSSVDDIKFLTNNGEKELALEAVNKSHTAAEMVTALEKLNDFTDADARIDLFTDLYFTNVTDDAEKLGSRKQKLANKLIAYREENGEFSKMDFSDISLAINSILDELKILSYTTSDEVLEDMLGIFVDTAFYDSDDKKIAAAALITELMNGEICNDVAELQALEGKARSIVAVSFAEDDAIIVIFDDVTNYKFDDIIDLTNEDYTKNKSAVAKKMTELRANDFKYYTINALKSDFNLATSLTAVNMAASRLDIANAISKYAEVLGLDLTEYSKYDSNLVCATFVDITFNSGNEIQQAINQRIAEIKSSSSNTSKPSNNHGGGGGGGGGAFVAPVPTVKPTQNTPVESVKEPFKDLHSVTWAKTAIESLYAAGKVNGVSDGVFEPNRSITRAEFSKLLTDIFELSTGDSIEFADVNENDWYYRSVLAVASAGIVQGNENGEFMPNQSLTRQDMAVMIYRLLTNTKNGNVVSKNGSVDSFKDALEINEYAKEAVGKLYSNGIVNGMGDNCFAPLNNTTRAEAAVILYRISNSLGGEIHE